VGAAFVVRLVEQITERGIGRDVLLNVNVPNLPHDEIKGVQVVRLGKRIYNDQLIERTDPRGRTYYWLGGNTIQSLREEGTDVAAIADGYVSITPIDLDLTNRALMETLRTWDLRF
jgi:5'-nucleotidase